MQEGWKGHSAQRGQKAKKALGQLRGWYVQIDRRPRQPSLTGNRQADFRAVRGSLQGTGNSLGFILSTVEAAEGRERDDELKLMATTGLAGQKTDQGKQEEAGRSGSRRVPEKMSHRLGLVTVVEN